MDLGQVLSGGLRYFGSSENEDLINQQRALIENARREAEAAVTGQLSPYTQAGGQALGQLSGALTSGFDFESDPGYQFRLSEGQKALERSLASRGLSQSGAALKAAQEYGQGLASQTYQDAYNRYLAQNSQLANLAGMGQNAAMGLGQALGNIPLASASANIDILNALAAQRAQRQQGLADMLGGFF